MSQVEQEAYELLHRNKGAKIVDIKILEYGKLVLVLSNGEWIPVSQ